MQPRAGGIEDYFLALHELREEIYGGLAGKIDEVAERKLALDRAADARLAAIAETSAPPPRRVS